MRAAINSIHPLGIKTNWYAHVSRTNQTPAATQFSASSCGWQALDGPAFKDLPDGVAFKWWRQEDQTMTRQPSCDWVDIPQTVLDGKDHPWASSQLSFWNSRLGGRSLMGQWNIMALGHTDRHEILLSYLSSSTPIFNLSLPHGILMTFDSEKAMLESLRECAWVCNFGMRLYKKTSCCKYLSLEEWNEDEETLRGVRGSVQMILHFYLDRRSSQHESIVIPTISPDLQRT